MNYPPIVLYFKHDKTGFDDGIISKETVQKIKDFFSIFDIHTNDGTIFHRFDTSIKRYDLILCTNVDEFINKNYFWGSQFEVKNTNALEFFLDDPNLLEIKNLKFF